MGSPLETGRALAVIPCLNEAAHIETLIAALLDDPDWSAPLVVVIDGGSTDGTREKVEALAAREPRVRLAHNPKRIQAAAVNLAATAFAADHTWLVRVDAHCAYPRGYVSALVGEARRTGSTAVVVSLRTEGRTVFQRAVARAQNSRLGTGGSAHRIGGRPGYVDHGHHALMNLEAFRAAGGYDEGFSHNEDAELDVRLRRRGGRIWLTDACPVVYYPRAGPWSLFRQYFNYGRGRAKTLARHRERPRLRQLAPLAVAPALAGLAAAPFSLPAAAPAAAWGLACCVYGLTIAVRRSDPCAILSGPAAMIMHAGWSLGFWAQVLIPASRPRSAFSGQLQAQMRK